MVFITQPVAFAAHPQDNGHCTGQSAEYGGPAEGAAASLENVVYLELCRRGNTVNIGKTADGEIDFVATRQNEKLYVQVTERITSEKTQRREYDRLLDIRDNYPKYVLRTDDFVGGNFEGIKTMHVADFLLSDEY